jgi:uncharacterized protein (DUF488 family)
MVLVVRKIKIEIPAVFTIGHSTRTWKEFLEILRAHRVERVIDVRSVARSRHNPQFNREILRTKLRAARIGYAFGIISSTSVNPRVTQLALKFAF